MSRPTWGLASLFLLATTTVAILAHLVCAYFVGTSQVFLIPFVLPVVVIAVMFGTRWGLLATFLNSAIVVYNCLHPADGFANFALDDQIQIGSFLVFGGVVSFFIDGYRKRVERSSRRIADRPELSDQNQATDTLNESERKFRAVFHSQFQFIGLMSPEGVLLEANRTALAAAGVSEEDVLGKPFWETAWWIHDPVQQVRLRESIRRAANGQPDRFEASHKRLDGSIMWVDFSLTPYIQDGHVVLLIPEGRDITERKQAEAAVLDSEQRFQAFMTHAPIAAWIVDDESRGVYTSPGFDRHLGLPPGAFLGLTPAELWPADIAQAYVQNNRRVLDEGIVLETEEPFVRRDGSNGMAYVIKFPFSPRGDSPMVGGVAIDITERQREQKAFVEKSYILETILNSMRESVLGCDIDGGLVVLNKAFRELHGLRSDETPTHLRDLSFSIRDPITHEPLAYKQLPLVRASRGEESDDVELEIATARRPNHKLFSVTGRPFHSAAGFSGGLIVLRDISVEKRNVTALRESEERFRNAFEFAPIGMAIVSLDGKWLRVNRSVCDLIGYAETELLKMDFQTITHPDDLSADLSLVEQVMNGTLSTYQLEKRYIHKEGRVVHVLLSVSLVRDTDGSPLHFISQIKDVTKQKKIEQELAANDVLLRQFIKHSPAAIAMFDCEIRYIQSSDRWLTDYHLVGRDIIGLRHYDVFPDIPVHWKEVHARVLKGTVERCDEDSFELADGSTEWLQWECRPWHDALGKIGGIIMFTQVITERKNAEAALRESELQFRAAMEGSLDSIFFLTAVRDSTKTISDFRFAEINDRGCGLLARPREQVLGKLLSNLLPESKANGTFEKYVRAVNTGEPHEEELIFEPSVGRNTFWRRRQVIRVGDGVTITTQDITERKRVEAELRLSEERFRRLVDGVANHAIFMLDTEGYVLSWNPAAKRLKGYEAEEILGRHFSTFYTSEALSANHPQLELEKAIVDGRYQEEGIRVRKDGSHFWADVTISSLSDNSGGLVGFVKFTHDITERKRSEELIRASLKEKEVMLKEIHHRVKNNLQIVSALLELQSGHTPHNEVIDMFKESQGRVRSMALIHERLYQSGNFAGVDFGEYVRQLADDLYRTYRITDDAVSLKLDIDFPLVPIDIAVPCGLLLNELISNCLKHAFQVATSGYISVRLVREGKDTVLSVSDNGDGFKPGIDFRNTSSFGLQLVNTLVEQLGGEILLTKSPGTTITIRFSNPS